MRLSTTQWVTGLITLILIVGGAFWWSQNMERRWTTTSYLSDAAGDNPMLAATRFLTQNGYHVARKDTLSAAVVDKLNAGMIILTSHHTEIPSAHAKALLAWVSRGGVLFVPTLPMLGGAHLSDEISDATGFYCSFPDAKPVPAAKAPTDSPFVEITPPGNSYPLRMAATPCELVRQHMDDDDDDENSDSDLEWGDARSAQLQVVQYGRGHIIVTNTNRFTNKSFLYLDHGELLLSLAQLSSNQRPIWIIDHIDTLPWYKVIWQYAAHGLSLLIVLILFLLWSAAVRFGPMLPSPDTERRALIEHIDASARWLWVHQAGRNLLLGAVRKATLAQLGRRNPELLRLGATELANRLAARTNLPQRQIDLALNQPPATRPVDFVQQIQTLQQLRKHNER